MLLFASRLILVMDVLHLDSLFALLVMRQQFASYHRDSPVSPTHSMRHAIFATSSPVTSRIACPFDYLIATCFVKWHNLPSSKDPSANSHNENHMHDQETTMLKRVDTFDRTALQIGPTPQARRHSNKQW